MDRRPVRVFVDGGDGRRGGVRRRARAIDAPLLANMTEFGKSKLLTTAQLTELGYNIVIYPATAPRLAMGVVEARFAAMRDAGTQAGLVEKMQTRARLYELLGYEDYNRFDSGIFNFEV